MTETENKCSVENSKLDPTFLNARREAIIVLVVWLAGMLWTVGFCALTGYNISAENVTLILGMPTWVFWGALVPWLIIIAFSIWFGLCFIADEKSLQKQNQSPPPQPRKDVESRND